MFLYEQYTEDKRRDQIGRYIARLFILIFATGALLPLVCGLLILLLGIHISD